HRPTTPAHNTSTECLPAPSATAASAAPSDSTSASTNPASASTPPRIPCVRSARGGNQPRSTYGGSGASAQCAPSHHFHETVPRGSRYQPGAAAPLPDGDAGTSSGDNCGAATVNDATIPSTARRLSSATVADAPRHSTGIPAPSSASRS